MGGRAARGRGPGRAARVRSRIRHCPARPVRSPRRPWSHPAASLDDAALRLRVAETALTAARSEREMAEATLARTRAALIGPLSSDVAEAGDACCVEITAPASGHVLSIVNRSARLVQPGEPLLEIGEPGDLEIEVDLLSSDAVRIAPGAAPTSSAGADRRLQRASDASILPPSPRSPPSASKSSASGFTSTSWTGRLGLGPHWETASGYMSGSSNGAARPFCRFPSHRSSAARRVDGISHRRRPRPA